MPPRQDRPYLLAGLGALATAAVVSVGGRLARYPEVVPPSGWFGLLSPLPHGHRAQPAVMLTGIAVLVGCWLSLCGRATRGAASPGQVAGVVCCWAAPIVLGPPILSLDVYSYAAQGVMLANGLAPYETGPAALGAAHPAARAVDPLWQGSNAPYGPAALAYFHAVAEVAGEDPLWMVLAFRFSAALAILVIALCAVSALPERPAWALAASAGSPLMLLHLLGGIHLEGMMMALVAAGLLTVERGRGRLGLVLLTTAVLVKWPAVLVLVAVLLWRAVAAAEAVTPDDAGRRDRALVVRRILALTAHDVAILATCGAALCALIPDGLGWIRAATTPSAVVTPYAPSTTLADLLAAVVRATGNTPPLDGFLHSARTACTVLAAVLILTLLATVRRRDVRATAGLSLLGLALLGPVLYPWYLTWALIPLAIARDSDRRARIVAITAAASFLALPGWETLVADHPALLPWLTSSAPYLVLTLLCWAAWSGLTARPRSG